MESLAHQHDKSSNEFGIEVGDQNSTAITHLHILDPGLTWELPRGLIRSLKASDLR